MPRRICAVLLSSVFLILASVPARAQGGANVISPKLCFTLSIPGSWQPAEDPGTYLSPDGKQFVGVLPRDAKDLKGNKGNTLVEKEGDSLQRDYEKYSHRRLTDVATTPLAASVPGVWKWSAVPLPGKGRDVPVGSRYIVDLSPDGVIVITIDGTSNDDELARNILATLRVSKTKPCQLPTSLKKVVDDVLSGKPAPSPPPAQPASDPNIPAREYKNPKFPWSIKYPGDWKLEAADPGQVRILRPVAGDQAAASVFSLAVQFTTVDEFADSWLRQTYEHMRSQGIKVRRADRKSVALPNGVSGIELTSEMDAGGQSGRSRSIFLLVDGVGYLVECETSAAAWESLSPVFAQIMNSFLLEKKP